MQYLYISLIDFLEALAYLVTCVLNVAGQLKTAAIPSETGSALNMLLSV
jgi:hypothetical protein